MKRGSLKCGDGSLLGILSLLGQSLTSEPYRVEIALRALLI